MNIHEEFLGPPELVEFEAEWAPPQPTMATSGKVVVGVDGSAA